MVTAIYPGTFDPLTRGHEDLVRRASGLFDKLIVGVADSKNKKPFFALDERLKIANEVLGHYPNVQVETHEGAVLRRQLRERGAVCGQQVRRIELEAQGDQRSICVLQRQIR